MDTYQKIVTRSVRHYMSEAPASQRVIGEALGVERATISRKLLGHRLWSLQDIALLHSELGIEFPLPAIARRGTDIVHLPAVDPAAAVLVRA